MQPFVLLDVPRPRPTDLCQSISHTRFSFFTWEAQIFIQSLLIDLQFRSIFAVVFALQLFYVKSLFLDLFEKTKNYSTESV